MARISGVNVPNEKKALFALTYIYGVGLTRSQTILKEAQVDANVRINQLSEADIEKIRKVISTNYKVEGDLHLEISQNVKRLKEINSYRGLRHTKGLPVRGQRTKTNARTKRSRKVTVGSGRKPSAQKT